MAGRASVQEAKKGFVLPQVPKIAVYIVGFIPAVLLFYAGITDQLGAVVGRGGCLESSRFSEHIVAN